jgi:positive regulator of sigma E activity
VTEQGIVKKIDGDRVQIAFREDCSACEKCGSCLSTAKPRLLTVVNHRNLAVAPGDRVEYSVSPRKAVAAAFMILVLPILLFFPGYYGAAALWSAGGEGLRVVAGLVGVALGFGVNLLLRWLRPDYPEIERVLGSQSSSPTAPAG